MGLGDWDAVLALRKFAEGRPSVTIVANGGGLTLNEIDANVRAGRRMILIERSGRAADALISLLRSTQPTDPEVANLRARAAQANLTRRPELFQIVSREGGAPALRDALVATLATTTQKP